VNPREQYEKETGQPYEITSTDEMYEAAYMNNYVEWLETHLTQSQEEVKELKTLIKETEMDHENCWPKEEASCTSCNARNVLREMAETLLKEQNK